MPPSRAVSQYWHGRMVYERVDVRKSRPPRLAKLGCRQPPAQRVADARSNSSRHHDHMPTFRTTSGSVAVEVYRSVSLWRGLLCRSIALVASQWMWAAPTCLLSWKLRTCSTVQFDAAAPCMQKTQTPALAMWHCRNSLMDSRKRGHSSTSPEIRSLPGCWTSTLMPGNHFPHASGSLVLWALKIVLLMLPVKGVCSRRAGSSRRTW